MKHGDLIITNKFFQTHGFRHVRKAVILRVTRRDIEKGIDVLTPGLYAFYGLWYGSDPLDPKCFGKCVEARGRVVGNVRHTNKRLARTLR